MLLFFPEAGLYFLILPQVFYIYLIYLYTVDEDNRIVFLKVKGIRETFEKRIEIPMDIPVEKIAEIIKREL